MVRLFYGGCLWVVWLCFGCVGSVEFVSLLVLVGCDVIGGAGFWFDWWFARGCVADCCD